ncbi:MAG: acyltransferase family protein [Bacteroides graminisolvens]
MENTPNNIPSKQRLLSLDVLRGLTVAGMILVNNGGGKVSYEPLRHSAWNGLSLADLVFPFFLFMVGVSTYISLRKFEFKWSNALALKIVKRTCLILLIGWAIYWFEGCCKGDFLPFDHMRIPGVLQRIALCYGVVSLLAVTVSHRWLPWLAGLLLAGYAFLLLQANGYVCDETNVLCMVDRAVFGTAHLYHKSPIDPEGLLGVIPSVAHTILGFWGGKILMEHVELRNKMLHLFIFGFVLMGVGLLFAYGLPINKRIWSPTLVLFTCGLATSLLAWFLYVIDYKGNKSWTPFFVSFGVNPLFIYVVSELMNIAFAAFGVSQTLFAGIYSVVPDAYVASLVYAIVFVLLNWAIGYPLYKKKIYIKI